MEVGVTDILAVVAPVFHEYVDAPLAVKVVDKFKQTEELAAETVTVGILGLRFCVIVRVKASAPQFEVTKMK